MTENESEVRPTALIVEDDRVMLVFESDMLKQ